MAFEFPVTQVFNPACFAIVITKLGNGQIHVTIAVQIARPDIRNPRDLVNHHVFGEMAMSVVFKNNDRTDFVVVGKQHSQNGNYKVQIAIFIEIDGLNMCRGNQISSKN